MRWRNGHHGDRQAGDEVGAQVAGAVLGEPGGERGEVGEQTQATEPSQTGSVS